MKFLGHPIHIMLIHFPSALFPMAFVCSLIAYYTGSISFTDASFYAMFGGVALGWVAIIAGALDLIDVANNHSAVIKKALLHGGINASVVIAYTVIAFIAFKNYPELVPDSLPILILQGALVAFMLAGNYFGGSLVLKDKVGVEK